MKKILTALKAKGIGLGIAMVVLAGVGIWSWYGPCGREERRVDIPLRSGTTRIARLLAEARVVRSAWLFRGFALASGKSGRLKAGEYVFKGGMSMPAVLNKLVSGDVARHDVTFPEGYTALQMAKKLGAEGLVDPAVFMAVVQNAELARQWGVPAASLEGFLFPDTYQWTKGMAPEAIAQQLVGRFHEKVQTEIWEAGKQQGLNPLQLITLASIVEREVRESRERPVVASVFYNRLHQRMRLESCATVLYSQQRTQGSLSLEDLETRSPYNTYRHRGLPPGPICNPGLSAIRAAAYPQPTKYLFFVVKPDGRHVFSEDFEAHKRAKWEQKRTRRIQPQLSPGATPLP